MHAETGLCAGYCAEPWRKGLVIQSQGNGFYLAIRDEQDLTRHFANYANTEFYPANRGVPAGQWVDYTLHPDGKVSCVRSEG